MAKKQKRIISAEARRRMADAGRKNLQAYRARCVAPAASHGVYAWLHGGPLPLELQQQIDNFEAELTADLGGQLNAAERALVQSAKTSYGVICLANIQLSAAPSRLIRKEGLCRTLATYQASLLRALKALKPRGVSAKRHSSEPSIADIAKEYAANGN